MLAAALGLAPSKDVWWSTAVQPGTSKYGKGVEATTFLSLYGNFFLIIYLRGVKAPAPAAHAAVATLTGGPVAPGDSIDHMNASLILRVPRL